MVGGSRRSRCRWSRGLGPALLGMFFAAACSPDLAGRRCDANADCDPGFVCEESFCLAALDGGGAATDGASAADGGSSDGRAPGRDGAAPMADGGPPARDGAPPGRDAAPPRPDGAPAECEDGTTERLRCGLNGNGEAERRCVGGAWTAPGPCDDPDECRDGTAETEPCGLRGNGTRRRTCASGRWSAWGACDDPDVMCEPGDREVAPCGLNGNGIQNRECDGGRFGPWSECDDPDECVNGAADQEACGLNGRGSRERSCADGRWGAFGECDDPDVCVDEAVEERACGPDGRGREPWTCHRGQWARSGECRVPCEPGAVETEVCGAGRRERACVDGFWGAWGPCTDVCFEAIDAGEGRTGPVPVPEDGLDRARALACEADSTSGSEVVFRFRAPVTGLYRVRGVQIITTPSLYVRRTCTERASEIACDRGALGEPIILLELERGEEVFIFVDQGVRDLDRVEIAITRIERRMVTNAPMIPFAGGSFVRGAPDDAGNADDARPRREIRLAAFDLDAIEVTVRDFERCVRLGLCAEPWDFRDCNWGSRLVRADHPINCVPWVQARNYCLAVGKTLPTEAQWERAAAGADGRVFPWGDDPPDCDRARYRDCPPDEARTRPVGAPASMTPDRVFDLAGNVSEWVQDCYDPDYYANAPEADPVNRQTGCDRRVHRGGGFDSHPRHLRTFHREHTLPSRDWESIGFRCARLR